ncbi:hypothetical protein GCM10010390_40280 [Streptomyces mordarskii]|uniref:Uncharacterized protein n=1 Tax=Streptomyces mordarskii TaxID=1226758 RepID=A0ABP3N3N9_9ACTN
MAGPMREADGKRGLAHPGGPGYQHYRGRPVRAITVVQQRIQLVKFGGPADEAMHIARELTWHRDFHAHSGRTVEVNTTEHLPGLHHIAS